jgi:hypothetical protein
MGLNSIYLNNHQWTLGTLAFSSREQTFAYRQRRHLLNGMATFKCPYCRTDYEMTTAYLAYEQQSYAKCQIYCRTMYSWVSETYQKARSWSAGVYGYMPYVFRPSARNAGRPIPVASKPLSTASVCPVISVRTCRETP